MKRAYEAFHVASHQERASDCVTMHEVTMASMGRRTNAVNHAVDDLGELG